MLSIQCLKTAVAMSTLVLLGACATGRTTIALPKPEVGPATAMRSPNAFVVLQLPQDQRVFEDAPGDPSTPSLGEEKASAASSDVRSRAVARKRHGYGMAQGDVVLKSPQTASSVIQAATEVALARSGFPTLPSNQPAPTSAVQAQVQIKEFWLWLETGVMVGTIKSRINVELMIVGKPTIQVVAETSQPGQIFSEEAWTNAVRLAVESYTAELTAKLGKLP